MISIPGYQIKDLIYQSEKSEIYKGVDESTGNVIALKTLRNEYPTIQEINRIQTEYEISKKFNDKQFSHAICLKKYKNRPVLIMEFIDGVNLQNYLITTRISTTRFLKIAIHIAENLDKIHNKNIIHKDINLSNIIWNELSEKIRIIDFGLASQLTRENQEMVHPDKLEGTIIYISPEQTGRNNRSIDYRTDYYSLGVSFYKMLTGSFPFESDDPIELVHAHIATPPLPPAEIDPRIPVEISDIIMKLIAKTPEERFQSVEGLLSDLQNCSTQLMENAIIQPFKIAQNDISSKFRIPEKLYGREHEINSLMKSFNYAASGNKAVVLFSGEAGIGKTAVINEIYKPVLKKGGYFVSGKFEAFKKNLPYLAIIEAVTKLVFQLLTEDRESLRLWKEKILEVLKGKGKVIADIIPPLEILIGKQPDVEVLPPMESQNRFNLIFQDFIKIFSNSKKPLVVFIDDLQWADPASLNLLQTLLSDNELKHFLLISAYRHEEVIKDHPFPTLIERFYERKIKILEIKLNPLTQQDITHILSDTLKHKDSQLLLLAKLVFDKTGGNPFFVKAFLKSLYNQGLILLKRQWQWDIEKINKAGVTDNVIELIAGKIKHLDMITLEIVKLACCFGSTINLYTLAEVYGETYQNTFEHLIEAINKGILIKVEDEIKFVHDKVREATYSIIKQEELQQLHYKIGKNLLSGMKKTKVNSNLFLIVEQLNQARRILSIEYKKKLILLNYEAGLKAKLSGAFNASASFFRNGAKLIKEDWWESSYKSALDYYNEWAEAEVLASNNVKAEELFSIIKIKSKKPLDKAKMISCKIDCLSNRMNYNKAVKVGWEYLTQLGVSIPEIPGEDTIRKMLEEIYSKIGNRKVKDLLNLPIMDDRVQITIITILTSLLPPACISGSPLTFIFALEAIDRSINYGIIPELACHYTTVPMLIGSILGDYEKGHAFSKLGVAIAEKFNNKLHMGKSYHMFTWTKHLKEPLKNNLEILKLGLQYSLETGDNQKTGYILSNLIYTNVLLGKNLEKTETVFNKYSLLITRINQPSLSLYCNIWGEFIKNLLGKSGDPILLTGELFNEKLMVPVIEENNDVSAKGWYALIKTMLYYYYEHYEKGLKYSLMGLESINGLLGQPLEQSFYFFCALTLIKNYNTRDDKTKKRYMEKIECIRRKYKIWYKLAPFNYEHKYMLIEAEYARMMDRDMKEVIGLYDKAIEGANKNNYIHDEALANECAAHFFLESGLEKPGMLYIREAHYCYNVWGMKPKVELLKKKYPLYIKSDSRKTNLSKTNSTSTNLNTAGPDLQSVMKASSALSGEIELGKLLEKMIKFVIESAGAEKGYFILPHKNELFIQAEWSTRVVQVLHSIPIKECEAPRVSSSIVHYVQTSRKSVVLHDAISNSTFSNDSYIKENKPKSVFCMPLINKNQITGILYMENNLSTGAFTEERLKVLNILSSQMAISIENARIYKELDESNKTLDLKVQEITGELNEKNSQLQNTLQKLQKTQNQLIESEKLAALGQLTAGISHEINTPLGAINSSIENTNDILNTLVPELPDFFKQLPGEIHEIFIKLLQLAVDKPALTSREERDIKKKIKKFLNEQGLESGMDTVLKLSIMGVTEQNVKQFSALVQNPFNKTNLDTAYKLSGIIQNTRIILSAARKAAKVTFALKNYTRFDHSGEKSEADIKETINTVLTLYQNHLKQGINVITQYDDVKPLKCYPDELNQVWTNIVHNAVQAMANNGQLTIKLREKNSSIYVSITDTGEGIPEEIKCRIFDPFFTTRPMGEGSGLGLNIVKRIVEKHNGRIDIKSSDKKGTTFIIILPRDV